MTRAGECVGRIVDGMASDSTVQDSKVRHLRKIGRRFLGKAGAVVREIRPGMDALVHDRGLPFRIVGLRLLSEYELLLAVRRAQRQQRLGTGLHASLAVLLLDVEREVVQLRGAGLESPAVLAERLA